MSVPDENLTKCTLLVQRSPQALTDYHTMLFPPHLIHQTKHVREEVDLILKVKSFTKHFFIKGKQNISSLQKIICSLLPFIVIIY